MLERPEDQNNLAEVTDMLEKIRAKETKDEQLSRTCLSKDVGCPLINVQKPFEKDDGNPKNSRGGREEKTGDGKETKAKPARNPKTGRPRNAVAMTQVRKGYAMLGSATRLRRGGRYFGSSALRYSKAQDR